VVAAVVVSGAVVSFGEDVAGGSVVSGRVVVTSGDDVTGAVVVPGATSTVVVPGATSAIVVSGIGVSGELLSVVYSSEGDTEELSGTEAESGGFLTSMVPSGGFIGPHEDRNKTQPATSSADNIFFIIKLLPEYLIAACVRQD